MNSCSTRSNRCRGTRLPLCCVGVKFSVKVDFAIWFIERPRRVHKCGYFLNIHFMIICSVDESDIRPIVLPVGFVAVR